MQELPVKVIMDIVHGLFGLLTLAFIFGKYTGASMNPARSLGPNIVTDAGYLILYTVAPVVGAVLSNFIPGPLDEEP